MHGDLVVVADLVDGSGGHTAAVHWHLDPRWTVETRARGAIFRCADGTRDRVGLTVPHGIVDRFTGDADSGLGWCSPAYGRVDRTTAIRISDSGDSPFWMVSVFDLDAANPVAGVDWVPVWAEAGAVRHAAAIRITRALSIDHVLFAEPAPAGHAPTAETAFGAAGVAVSPLKPRWRVGDVETDARMLFYRSTIDRPFSRVAFVDGSLARAGSRTGLDILLPEAVAAFFTDRTTNQQPRTEDHASCAASPVS
jgi:hypothetical protein